MFTLYLACTVAAIALWWCRAGFESRHPGMRRPTPRHHAFGMLLCAVPVLNIAVGLSCLDFCWAEHRVFRTMGAAITSILITAGAACLWVLFTVVVEPVAKLILVLFDD